MFCPIAMRRRRRAQREWILRSHHTAAHRLARVQDYLYGGSFPVLFAQFCDMPWYEVADRLRRARLRIRIDRQLPFKRVLADAERQRVFSHISAEPKPVTPPQPPAPERPPAGNILLHVAPAKVAAGTTPEAARDAMRVSLSTPKAMAGAKTEDEVDLAAARIFEECPWLQEPLEYLWHAAREAADQGVGLYLPPVLLVGPPGAGKTHAATRLAEMFGLAQSRIDCSAATAAFALTGLDFGWRSARVGEPIRLISETGVANPLIILDEIDKAPRGTGGGDVVTAALPLLQRTTAATFRCPYLEAPIDLSWISWILTANEIDKVPGPLRDRCAAFQVNPPRGADLAGVVRRTFAQLDIDEVIICAVAEQIEAGQMSLRALARLVVRFRAINRRPWLN